MVLIFLYLFISPALCQPNRQEIIRERLQSEALLNVDNIQGDIAIGHAVDYQRLLAFDIVDISSTKNWIRDVVRPLVTSTRDLLNQSAKKDDTAKLSLSFSYGALEKLTDGTIYEGTVTEFSPIGAFALGGTTRSAFIGDPTRGEGAPNDWDFGSQRNPEILVNIGSNELSVVLETVEVVLTGIQGTVNLISDELGFQTDGEDRDKEHFGFLDNLSQPTFWGVYEDNDSRNFVLPREVDVSDPRWTKFTSPGFKLIQPGEFLLGYPQQNPDVYGDVDAPGPSTFIGPDWAKDGSFLVYRKLQQEVAVFWNFFNQTAEMLGDDRIDDEFLAEKIVGRRRDGSALFDEPGSVPVDDAHSNRFQFDTAQEEWRIRDSRAPDGAEVATIPASPEDKFGSFCPNAAHIRKMFPRDRDTDQGISVRTNKHRIIRRGITYGPRISNRYEDDGVRRGLLFLAYQNDIEQKFEFLRRNWANSPVNPDGGGDDVLLGQDAFENRRVITIQAFPDEEPIQVETQDFWIVPKGGAYFLTPSISAIDDVLTI